MGELGPGLGSEALGVQFSRDLLKRRSLITHGEDQPDRFGFLFDQSKGTLTRVPSLSFRAIPENTVATRESSVLPNRFPAARLGSRGDHGPLIVREGGQNTPHEVPGEPFFAQRLGHRHHAGLAGKLPVQLFGQESLTPTTQPMLRATSRCAGIHVARGFMTSAHPLAHLPRRFGGEPRVARLEGLARETGAVFFLRIESRLPFSDLEMGR